MKSEYQILAAVWLHSLLIIAYEGPNESLIYHHSGETVVNETLLSAGVYAKLFDERRIEHQLMIRKMMASGHYENNFKLLQLAYGKIFEGIAEKNLTLTTYGYEASRDRFPRNSELQDAVIFILENCCMAAESLLHFPEISYRILDQTNFSQWKTILNWCNGFVNSLPHVIDESTAKLMNLLLQEINEDQRTSDYVNPYYKVSKNRAMKQPKKQTKKLRKGPSLSRWKTEL